MTQAQPTRGQATDLASTTTTASSSCPTAAPRWSGGEILGRYPEIADLPGVVSERLNDDLMQELNGRVDIDGEDPADVAYDWLKSESLVA